MVKGKATAADGRVIVLVGLSAVNLERLRKGQPILFDVDELGVGLEDHVGHVAIFHGETEAAMIDMLAELITPATRVDDRTKDL